MKSNELEEKMDEIGFPKDLDSKSISSQKKNSLFSKAIFVESLRSNSKSLFIISFFNALIMIVIVLILSTLHMNSTKRALSNMFSGADTESSLKMGAISHYLGFKKTAEGIVTFDSKYEESVNGLTEAIDLADSITMQTLVTNITDAYDATYDANTETLDENARHNFAKTQTLSIVGTLMNSTNYSDQEKEIATLTLGYVLDYHHQDDTLTNKDLLIKSIPEGTSDYLIESINSEDKNETRSKIKVILDTAFVNTYEKNIRSYESATISTFDLIPMIISSSDLAEEYGDSVTNLVNKLKEAYENPETKNTYLNDAHYRRKILSSSVLDIVVEYLNEFAYYSNLPNFSVIYQTSYYGKPVYLEKTNFTNESGVPIYKEVEATSYMPDKFIELSKGMGIESNLLHKMNKKIITGEDYTQQEIDQAKKDSTEEIQLMRNNIQDFVNKFIESEFFDGNSSTQSLTEYVKNEVDGVVLEIAEKSIIDLYEEKTGKHVESVSQIGANEISNMSGKEMIKTIDGYIVSSMATYDILYDRSINENRTSSEATLASVVHASQGVIDMLPNDVENALTELTSLNSYGFFVGILAMGIACVLVPLVYNILLANSLVVDKVQTGSLAFVLSTPTNRSTFIFTEAMYLLFSQVTIFVITLIGCLFSRTIGIWMGSQDLVESLAIKDLILYSVGNFGVITAVSSICFLTSCIFNKSKYSIGIGGGINIFFFVATVLGLFGTKIMPSFIRIEVMDIFNYLSIITLYDATSVMTGNYLKYVIKLLSLFVLSFACVFSGIKVFIKKDLPL